MSASGVRESAGAVGACAAAGAARWGRPAVAAATPAGAVCRVSAYACAAAGRGAGQAGGCGGGDRRRLVAKAAGCGHRRIAERLGRPPATVRGWLRRFAARAGWLRAAFTTLLCELDADPPVLEPQGSALSDAVAAIVAAMGAAGGRWWVLVGLSPWELAAAVTGGRLLSPGSRVEVGNTNCPW